ncbi:hypothetical protein C474_18545 [Halogeometricum pallidum JCM 14848]|uniref:Uncharacterized protein n=1 Tax=Halogeometricum pallidum JCM 14848 TaxID=1227487 RepID=M0CVL4_HALPD|nr:hypothetical protein [Halogeometricum pallidum]ELZ26668.1 hypothetical protein C474_18545 [Halogeometricum pallidum JCM 14848]
MGSSEISEILLVNFNLSTLSANTYNVSAVETADPITEGLSANKTVEDQLKVVPGVAPELRSAVRYDNGTDAEVELAFDENVSVVRTLNVSTVGGDANLTESVSVSEGRVVATLNGAYADDLRVTYDVVDEVGNGYAADPTAAVQSAAVTTRVGDDDTVYEGSTLAVLTDRTNASVDVANDSVNWSESTGANSKVFLLDTGTLNRGAYDVVYGGDGDRNATFDVESLGLAVGVDDATVTNDDGAVIAGTVSADAGGRSVAVELRDAGENMVATDVALLDGRGEYDYAFDAAGLATGDYAVVAVDDASGAKSRSGPVAVSRPPSDDGDGDSEYGDYRDPTPTETATPSSTERPTADAGPITESSGGTAANDASDVGSVAENKTTADEASGAAERTRSVTASVATDAATSPAVTSATPSESGVGTATGTEVPGFGVGAAAAALFLGASLAALAVRRNC